MTESDGFAPAPKHGFPANAKGFLFPPIVWAAFFVLVYSIQGAGCASGLRHARILGLDGLNLILGVLTAGVAAAMLIVGMWSYLAWRRIRTGPEGCGEEAERESRFLAAGAALNAALFLVATLWTGLPITWTAACVG